MIDIFTQNNKMNRVYHTLQKRFIIRKMSGNYMKNHHYTNRYYTNRYYTSFHNMCGKNFLVKQYIDTEVEKINNLPPTQIIHGGGGSGGGDNVTAIIVAIMAALCIYNVK